MNRKTLSLLTICLLVVNMIAAAPMPQTVSSPLMWPASYTAVPNCDGVVVTNLTPIGTTYKEGSKWYKLVSVTGEGTFGYNPGGQANGQLKYHWVMTNRPYSGHDETKTWHADKPESCNQPPEVPGCMDPNALNFNPEATVDDGSCQYPPDPIPGCMDPNALNFNPEATVDDGSCQYPPEEVPGCMDPNALNFNPEATVDDGSCQYPPEEVPGCMDPNALNFNPEATVDDGSCEYPPVDQEPYCLNGETIYVPVDQNPPEGATPGACTPQPPDNKPPKTGTGPAPINDMTLPIGLGSLLLIMAGSGAYVLRTRKNHQ